ncbi:MAG: AbrB/MazE/SpoVT family DNA-binding domain-containing protein [Gemmatimonadales bacterium]|nr:MAG: AbrB/MazE/SpoVT family DNA-binding domain-containing protein [Gemmatimonadales bacterium]
MNITTRVGKRGTIVIPAALRKRLGLEEGDLVITEDMGDGILIRPATVIPIETYTPERRAEFILTNAVDEPDYARARDVVRSMGFDPDNIEHERPGS